MTNFLWKLLFVCSLLFCVLLPSIGDAPAQAAPATQDAPKFNTAVITGTAVQQNVVAQATALLYSLGG
jgi:hypothetical protein